VVAFGMTNDWLNCTASLEQFPYFADALLFVADENFDIFGMMVFLPRKPQSTVACLDECLSGAQLAQQGLRISPQKK